MHWTYRSLPQSYTVNGNSNITIAATYFSGSLNGFVHQLSNGSYQFLIIDEADDNPSEEVCKLVDESIIDEVFGE